MKLRRVADEVGFRAALAVGLELPVWIRPGSEGTFAAKIDPVLAELPAGGTLEWADPVGVAGLREQPILGLQNDLSGRLAECYARCLGRPFVPVGRSGFATAQSSNLTEPRITVVLPVCGIDSREFIDAVRSSCERCIGRPVALGLLTADTLETLTWLLVKQIRGWREPDRRIRSVTFVDGKLSGPLAGLGRSGTVSRTNLAAALHSCDAPLLLHGHARPHCGVVSVADGLLGICGSPTRARAAKCFDDKPCLFGDDPKVLVEDV
ncbi:MAG: hypothetical protein JO057_05385, partial [Chloroflexi bacterium]|nr:hypothetical protein [Chloroflexota bacterium]